MTKGATRARYAGVGIENGRLYLEPAPGVDARELKTFGGRWNKSRKLWHIPARIQDVRLLQAEDIRVELTDEVAAELTRFDALDQYLQDAETFKRSADHPHWDTLMPHQRVGVAFLASRERGLLAFTPGLGKTATAVIAAEVRGYRRVLVVAPLTLNKTWENEITRWTSDGEQQVSRNPVDGAAWTVTNPEQVFKRGKEKGLREDFDQQWDLVVLDESVLYKNRKAKRTQAMIDLGKVAQNVWLLSGAPVVAYADDLFSQMQILRPDVFTSYWRFAGQWCQLEQTPWATQVVGNRAPERLKSYLSDLMLSRTPEEVTGLPEAIFERVDVELEDEQVDALDLLREKGLVKVGEEVEICDNVLAKLTRSAQLLSYPKQLHDGATEGAKLKALKGMLKDWLQLPAIVWTQFKATAAAAVKVAEQAGHSAASITGETSKAERDELINRFQSGDLDVLVVQLQTGKFGLSLTAAKSAVFVDRSYSSDDWIQAIARVRRLSSEAPVPNYVIHAGSIDNLVDDILAKKLHSIHDLSLSDLAKYL